MADADRPPTRGIEWAAGLFEGEGTISANRLAITMKDLDALEEFHRIIGVGSLHKHNNPGREDQWTWRTRNIAEGRAAVVALLPYFCVRRLHDAIGALDHFDLVVAERACEHCGRPFTPERTMRGHQRFCSVRCQKAAQYVRAKERGVPWADPKKRWQRELGRRTRT